MKHLFILFLFLFLTFVIKNSVCLANNGGDEIKLLLPGETSEGGKGELLARGDGWGDHSGITTFLDKIVSLLAFLSFGMFLLNLLLNAYLLFNSLFGLTLTSTGTGTGTGGGTTTGGTTTGGGTTTTTGGTTITVNPTLTVGRMGTDGRKRGRRSATAFLQPATISEGMAKELMDVVGAVIGADEECLPKILCVANRRAAAAGNGFQYLMPLCSFGASWFRASKNRPDYVSAIYSGAREESCAKAFGQEKKCQPRI